MITTLFMVAGLGIGFGMGMAGAKLYVVKKVKKTGNFSFRQNNVEYVVVSK